MSKIIRHYNMGKSGTIFKCTNPYTCNTVWQPNTFEICVFSLTINFLSFFKCKSTNFSYPILPTLYCYILRNNNISFCIMPIHQLLQAG